MIDHDPTSAVTHVYTGVIALKNMEEELVSCFLGSMEFCVLLLLW